MSSFLKNKREECFSIIRLFCIKFPRYFLNCLIKEGYGLDRTCTNDPWRWTTVWELTVGAGGGIGRGGQRGEIGTTVIE